MLRDPFRYKFSGIARRPEQYEFVLDIFRHCEVNVRMEDEGLSLFNSTSSALPIRETSRHAEAGSKEDSHWLPEVLRIFCIANKLRHIDRFIHCCHVWPPR